MPEGGYRRRHGNDVTDNGSEFQSLTLLQVELINHRSLDKCNVKMTNLRRRTQKMLQRRLTMLKHELS